MKPSFRIITLLTAVLMFTACGRPEREVASDNNGPTKQITNYDFVYEDRIPLVQVQDSFTQEAIGILKTKFELSARAHVVTKFAVVKINGQLVTSGYYIDGQDLVFDLPPVSSAKISVSYDPERLRDAVSVSKITLPENLDVTSIRGLFNGKPLYLGDLRMARNAQGELVLDPAAIIFDHSDSFDLINHRGLSLEIAAVKVE